MELFVRVNERKDFKISIDDATYIVNGFGKHMGNEAPWFNGAVGLARCVCLQNQPHSESSQHIFCWASNEKNVLMHCISESEILISYHVIFHFCILRLRVLRIKKKQATPNPTNKVTGPWTAHQGPLLRTWLTLILVWISNYIHYKVWYEVTHPFPNFNVCSVEVWDGSSNFIPHLTGHVIIYPCWD